MGQTRALHRFHSALEIVTATNLRDVANILLSLKFHERRLKELSGNNRPDTALPEQARHAAEPCYF